MGKKATKPLNHPAGLMQSRKLRVILSECLSSLFFVLKVSNVYSRLVKKIRLRDGSTSNNTGLLTKDWDFNIEEREAEFKDDLRAASGIGHKKRKVCIVALS